MLGPAIQTKARTILDEGIQIGREQGIEQGIEQGVQMALESLVAKGWITQEQADEQLQAEKTGRDEP